jgi:hypothetical protein
MGFHECAEPYLEFALKMCNCRNLSRILPIESYLKKNIMLSSLL